MSVVSICVIAGLLKVVLADRSLSISQYVQATDDQGNPVCSASKSSVVIYGVRRRVSCLLEHCVPIETCFSTNYYTVTGKCELYHYPSADCLRSVDDCVHYQVMQVHYHTHFMGGY